MPNILDKYIREISIESGIDPESVKLVYRAVVRNMVRGLREDGCRRLPRLGTFRISTRIVGHNVSEKGGFSTERNRFSVVKFKPTRDLKEIASHCPDYRDIRELKRSQKE